MSYVASFSKGYAKLVIDEYMLCSPVYMTVKCRRMRDANKILNDVVRKLDDRFSCKDVIMRKCVDGIARNSKMY